MAGYTSKFAIVFCVSLLRIAAGQIAPEIFVAPSAMHVDYGSTAYMACVAYIGTESQSNGIVTQMNWYNPHSQPLTNSSDGSTTVYTMTKTQNGHVFLKSILKICNFTTDDFGSYTCRVTNVYGQNDMSWIVSIVRLPISPRMVTSPTSLTTTAGKTIYMTCSAYGYPYPLITWRRDGQVVQSDGILTIDTRIKNYNGANVTVSTIRVCGVDSDYMGSYTCTATIRDIGQITSQSWRLDVTPVPSIASAPDNHTVNYGVTAYWTCTAYIGTVGQRADSLTSTLSWIGPDSQQLANRTDGTVSIYTGMDTRNGRVFLKSYLKICNFTQSNTGVYSCRVSNANGQANKTWEIGLPYPVNAPRLVGQPTAQSVSEGNTVYMSCAVYGYPFPEIVWFKDGQLVGDTNSTLTISNNIVNYNGALVVQSTLKMCLVGVEDSGMYSCRAATRDFGTLNSPNAALTVLPVPSIIVAPEDQTVNYGVTFFMTCAAHVGNTAQNAQLLSTTLTWRGPDDTLLTNSTEDVTVYTDTITTQQGHVIIRSIIQICGFAADIEGIYSCEVSNANGQDIRTWNNTLPMQPIAPVVVAAPTTQTVNEGNSVIMTCAGFGYPYPTITWYRNSQPLDPNLVGRVNITTRLTNYNGALVRESIMKICGAGEEDHGSYYCSFSSAFGSTVNSNVWQVNVSPVPTIVVAPQDHTVEYSRTVFMTCAAHVGTVSQNAGTLTTTFNWFGPDSQAINNSTTFQIFTDTSTQSGRVFVRSILKICSFGQQNAGQYTCRVQNANGNENRTWTTSFPDTPVIPQLAAVSAYEGVTSGRSVYFACAMYGYPQPEITWTRDDNPLDTVSTTVNTTYIAVNNINITWSVIRVCNFQSANNGLYQCAGRNALGTSVGYTKVILEAPEIVVSPNSRMVNYAHTIYMSCVALVGRMNRSVDQLTTTLSWTDSSNRQLANSTDGSVSIYTSDTFVRSGLVFLTSILKICNFSQSATGQHMCTVMNSNGQHSANWNLTFLRSPTPPIFLVTPSTNLITAATGRTVYLYCAVYGFPFPRITWTKDGQVIQPNDTMYRVNYDSSIVNYGGAQVTQSILKICGSGEEDIGNYVCVATSSAFTSTITTLRVPVRVTPVPTIVVAPYDQELTFGKTTLMTCVAFVGLTTQNATTIPTPITWLGPSFQQLNNNSDNSVSVYTRTQTQDRWVFTESILKLCNFSQALEGSYSCLVSNTFGDDRRSWNVSVHGDTFVPRIIAFPVAQSSRRYGYTVLMACAAYGYPPPIISFNQQGQPINQADLDGPFRVNNTVQTYLGGVDVALGVLEICTFDYDDAVNYSCVATARNVGQAVSTPWSIGLIPAPFLVRFPQSQNVSYDTTLRMTCIAALGRPADAQPTSITWFDAYRMRMDNSSAGVTVTNTMYTNVSDNIRYLRSDAVVSSILLQYLGDLSCNASNSLGYDVATWTIRPVLDYVQPSGVSIANIAPTVRTCGAAVTLTCRAWGYPPPNIAWTLNGTIISTSNQAQTLGLNYTDGQLSISQFSLSNAGVYVCNATNVRGSAKSEPVQLSLDMEVSIDTDPPTISSSVRTGSMLAVVEFKPASNNMNQEFLIRYYTVANNSGIPDLSQVPSDGSYQSKGTQVSVPGLTACNAYWITVTVVNSCGIQRSQPSRPLRVDQFDSTNFQLFVILPDKSCTTWITEDVNTKINDVTTRLGIAATTCGITLPCPLSSSQWLCQDPDNTQRATFTTQLVGDDRAPTQTIVSCFNTWIKDNGDSAIQIGDASYVVSVPLSETGPQVSPAVIGVVIVVAIVVLVGIIVAVIVGVVMFRARNKKPVKKEKLEEQRPEDFSDVYSRHSFAVVENPLFADQEEGDDASYSGGVGDGYEYDSGTLDKKEDFGAEGYDDDDDDRAFI